MNLWTNKNPLCYLGPLQSRKLRPPKKPAYIHCKLFNSLVLISFSMLSNLSCVTQCRFIPLAEAFHWFLWNTWRFSFTISTLIMDRLLCFQGFILNLAQLRWGVYHSYPIHVFSNPAKCSSQFPVLYCVLNAFRTKPHTILANQHIAWEAKKGRM